MPYSIRTNCHPRCTGFQPRNASPSFRIPLLTQCSVWLRPVLLDGSSFLDLLPYSLWAISIYRGLHYFGHMPINFCRVIFVAVITSISDFPPVHETHDSCLACLSVPYSIQAGRQCPRMLSSWRSTPASRQQCLHLRRATFTGPIDCNGFLLPIVQPRRLCGASSLLHGFPPRTP